MLIPDNIHPENSLYYAGALILDVLMKKESMDMLDLFAEVKEKKELTFPVFILGLDWLFLIDVAIVKDQRVELCS